MIEQAKEVAQRLRDVAQDPRNTWKKLDTEAADTIDALCAEVEHKEVQIHGLRNRNDHLAEEVERLREALENVSNMSEEASISRYARSVLEVGK